VKPIAVQLYSLREEAQKNFRHVLHSVAEMGYQGVEPAGFHGMTPREFRDFVEGLGMRVCSSHSPWANPDNINEVIETVGILGLDKAAGGFRADDFKDIDAIKRTSDIVNGMAEALARANIDLFLHNHYWEFEEIDGRLAYDWLADMCPDVKFEIDTYWAANFGANDPAEQVSRFRDRTPLLHIKDGPLEKGKAMVAVGRGKMKMASVIGAANPDVLEWLIVELDACDTDMTTAIRESYDYLSNLIGDLE
jgi:sugar phosphate isomerase/epimerase